MLKLTLICVPTYYVVQSVAIKFYDEHSGKTERHSRMFDVSQLVKNVKKKTFLRRNVTMYLLVVKFA